MRTIALLVGLTLRFGAPLPERDSSSTTLPPVCELGETSRAFGSMACMSCHDGSIAAHVGGLGEAGSGRHPVDVDYQEAVLKHPDSYRPLGLLPSPVTLEQGKLTCTTCHAAASSEPGHTSLPMERSRLCLACHLY